MNSKIVGVITSLNEAEIAKKCGADLVELRVDLLRNYNYSEILIKNIKKNLKLPIICTIRIKKEGGKFDKPETEQLKLFKKTYSICRLY